MRKRMQAANDEVIIPAQPKAQPEQTDMMKFISKYQPSKFKELRNGIEVRSVYNLHDAMNKARGVIKDLGLGLVINHDAMMAANRSFEVREVVS